jgi:predicted alpha/beta hydrolase
MVKGASEMFEAITVPFKVRDTEVVTHDGVTLAATLFEPTPARGSVVVLGATGAPASYYARFATFLAGRGYRVLTFDYRGIGRSRPTTLRGYAATMEDWALSDARAAIQTLRAVDPDGPLALIGHSFGGQLIGLLDEARHTRAAVLMGAQLGYYGHWGGAERVRLAATWRVLVPALVGIFGYLPGGAGIGTDLPGGVALQWARWCRHPEYLMGEFPDARDRYRRFDVPTLVVSARDDDFAPERAVRALIDRLPATTVWRRILDPIEFNGAPVGHFGFFRPRFESVWREVEEFIGRAMDGSEQELPWRARSPGAGDDLAGGLAFDEILADLQFGRT